MDKRLKTVIALSVISLVLLTIAWMLSNRIAVLQPSTAQSLAPLISNT